MFETNKYNFLFKCQASDRIILTLDNNNQLRQQSGSSQRKHVCFQNRQKTDLITTILCIKTPTYASCQVLLYSVRSVYSSLSATWFQAWVPNSEVRYGLKINSELSCTGTWIRPAWQIYKIESLLRNTQISCFVTGIGDINLYKWEA